MRYISKILKTFGLAVCTGLVTTSCDVELMPLNEVVLENYWTDKSDVESVLNSCYTAMQSGSWITRAVVWGEVRSDNIAVGPDVPVYLKDIIKGNLKQANEACNWVSFYTAINYCNTLIYYAPQVAEKDPNLTTSDLNSYVAQAKGIRALNYFYLIRSFKDVPFTFEPSIDDMQDYVLPATADTKILDTLIMDIEACKDQAPVRYTTQTTSSDYKKNSGRMTRVGLYALLADMYLWRASDANLDVSSQQYYYRKCIECADYVLDFKKKEYDDDEDGTLKSKMDTRVYSNYGYPLIAESSVGGGSSSSMNAYEEIFGDGNSWESLFEITFTNSTSESETKNRELSYLYGGENAAFNSVRYLSASSELLSTAINTSSTTYSDQSLFPVTTDCRSLTSFHFSESETYAIRKYVTPQFNSASHLGTCAPANWAAGEENESYRRGYTEAYANWIVYRLTDVMLMRAEAEIQLAGILDQQATPSETETEDTSAAKLRRASAVDGSSLSTAQEYYDDAFNLICAVYTRSNYNAANTSSYYPSRSSYTSYDGFMSLLENERQREFLFEGKRYYDLVRRARREGNTSHFANTISTKFGEASKAVLIKMAMMDFMYMPYAKSELDVNTYLTQNPAYVEDDDRIQN